MRIGIDIRSLEEEDRFRGIGAYLSNLLRAISRIDDENQYLLYLWDDDSPLRALGLASTFKRRLITLRRPPGPAVIGRLKNVIMRDIRVSPRDVDVFLQPNTIYGLPWGNIPMVAVAYDMIPLVFRDQYLTIPSLRQAVKTGGFRALLKRALYTTIYLWSVRQLTSATRIVAISDATRRDIVRYFPHLRDRVTVTRLAHDESFRRVSDTSSVLGKFGIDRPFLLYVGSVDFRKNVMTLLEAYDRLREDGHNVQLVLVGKEFALKEGASPDLSFLQVRIANSKFVADIVRTGFVDRADLTGLYSSALALVFPSLYEGFGLPILEAMACGCPVIAYRNSSILEVAGTAAILLDPSQDLAETVAMVIRDDYMRRSAAAAGLAQAGKFSWERTAAETLRVLKGSVSHER